MRAERNLDPMRRSRTEREQPRRLMKPGIRTGRPLLTEGDIVIQENGGFGGTLIIDFRAGRQIRARVGIGGLWAWSVPVLPLRGICQRIGVPSVTRMGGHIRACPPDIPGNPLAGLGEVEGAFGILLIPDLLANGI